MTALAVISDIHGNRWALAAVLADITGRGVDAVVNLGDSFYGPLDPAGTAAELLDRGIPGVCGNEDRLILEPASAPDPSPTLAFVRRQLPPAARAWLATLAGTREIAPGVHMCHGTPRRDDEYLLWEVGPAGATRCSPAELAARMPAGDCRLLLCGHDHVPHTARLPDGRLIVDPGSVGLPAFADDVPFPHRMAVGSPHARYSIVRAETGGEWQVEPVAVAYDWEAAAATAARNGRPDWAMWLRTGRA